LTTYVDSLRNPSIFDSYEERTIKTCGIATYRQDTSRKRRRKAAFDEVCGHEVEFTGRDSYRIKVFSVIVDRLSAELRRRSNAYEAINDNFSFLTNLHRMKPHVAVEKAKNFQTLYFEDVEDSLHNECLHLQAHLISIHTEGMSAIQLYNVLNTKGLLEVYPNVEVALRILLCTPASNCSAERSFSSLRRIKNYLRSTTDETKLNELAILYIESDLLSALDYEDVIKSFAEKKVRRKQF
jgi:hypothetical protein